VVAVATAVALGVITRDALGALAVVAGLHLPIDAGKAHARPGLWDAGVWAEAA